MPIVNRRDDVLRIYRDAAHRGWVLPAFNAENLTTIEAVLSAVKDYGEHIDCPDLPIVIGITNLYSSRPQSINYTFTRQWDIGLKLFLADLSVLTSRESPFGNINVMVHLDHFQQDLDAPLLTWDLSQFSSIMFDASGLPFDQNIETTRNFVKQYADRSVIEGACDEIVTAEGDELSELTSPDRAERYLVETGVDLIAPNLGTEHRSSTANKKYHGHLARQIKERVGAHLVLHGSSSVPNNQMGSLFGDGICKVNIWTGLERDSSPSLLIDMVKNAAKVTGSEIARQLAEQGYLGANADLSNAQHLDYFTTVYRQGIIFERMKQIVMNYLMLLYV